MNIVRMLMICSLTAAPLWAADNPVADNTADAVEFHFKAEPGQVCRSRVVVNTFGSMSSIGNMSTQRFSQKFEQELRMKCVRVNPDKSIVFELSMPAMAVQMNIGGIKLDIDTRKPAATSQPVFGFLSRIFDSMTRVTCTVTMSPDGEPLKVEGLQDAFDTVMKESGSLLALPGIKQLVEQMQDFLGDNVVAENLRTTWRLYPDGKKARIGDKWTREWQMKMSPFNMDMQGKGEYELTGIETLRGHPCAVIRAKSTMSASSQQQTGKSGAASKPRTVVDRMRFNMNASGGNSVAYLDYTTGQLVQLRETSRTVIDFKMDADPAAANDDTKTGLGKVSQTMTTSVQIDLIEDEPNGAAVSPADARVQPAATAPAQ